MQLLSRALQRLSATEVSGYYINALMAGPVRISFSAASTVPQAVVQAMNQYFGDKGNEQARLTWSGAVQGINTHTFENRVGVEGALAETDDLAKASNIFRSLGLMKGKPTVQKPQQKPKGPTKQVPDKKLGFSLVVSVASPEKAEEIQVGIQEIIDELELDIKVNEQTSKEGSDWVFSFSGEKPDKHDMRRFQEKVEDYLYDTDFSWEGLKKEKRESNEGDYAYEKSRLDIF